MTEGETQGPHARRIRAKQMAYQQMLPLFCHAVLVIEIVLLEQVVGSIAEKRQREVRIVDPQVIPIRLTSVFRNTLLVLELLA